MEADTALHCTKQTLNVFAPHRKNKQKEVLLFIHGGNWNSGKKSLYNFLGSRLARKNVVTVIIDYPLSPLADYNDMAVASAQAVKWTSQNIEKYGGNPNKIFVSGHSAGGHLAALITLDNNYFEALKFNNPIRGVILIDAAGLDMYSFLKKEKSPSQSYFKTFTKNPEVWKNASPLYHLHEEMPSMLLYCGEKTYPSILEGNEKFIKALNNYKTDASFHMLKGKKHIPMITQFFWPYNPRYKEIIEFMDKQKNSNGLVTSK